MLAATVAALCAAGLPLAIPAGKAGPAAPSAGKPGTQLPRTAAAERPSKEKTASEPHVQRAATGGVPGSSEDELRSFEEATLGPEHAKEHALQRRAGDGRQPTQGPSARAAVAGPPDEVGQWNRQLPGNAPFDIPVMAIHSAVLPTGKVMWFSYPKNPSPLHGGDGDQSPNTAQAWLWDPKTGSHTRVDPPIDPDTGEPANIWCAGQSFTADGRLVVVGGNRAYATELPNGDPVDFKGLKRVYTFNPYNGTWKEQPKMNRGRWYPSLARMADGRLPILAGKDETGASPNPDNRDVDLFEPSTDPNGVGTTTDIGTIPDSLHGGLYPHMFAMPSGRMLIAGPEKRDSWFLKPPGSADAFNWTDAPEQSTVRIWGTGVLVPGGPNGSTKVMQLGGSPSTASDSPATDTTEVFDETPAPGAWTSASSMKEARSHHNTVLLPDGSMVTVGGGFGKQGGDQWAADARHKQIELWDPTTKEWRLGPSQVENRAYHSTAMLLPDGRVVSAGDDVAGGIGSDDAGLANPPDTAEIYEPPYLFKGPRPTIAAAPTAVPFGAGFNVDTSSANVTRAALVAPAAVTHAVDMNQRYIPLSVSKDSCGNHQLTAPATPDIATPGMYMLFLLNDQGVPSEAKWVRLGAPGTPIPPRTCGTPGGTPGGTTPVVPGPQGPSVDRVKPRLSGLRLAPGAFPSRSRIRFSLSEAASVTFRVERAGPGRKVGRRCARPTRANASRRRCTRYVRLRGSAVGRGAKGRNSRAFTRRFNRRLLKPGLYRVVAVARDKAGNTSVARRAPFRVKRRRAAR